MNSLDLVIVNVVAVSTTCWPSKQVPLGMCSEIIEIALTEVNLATYEIQTHHVIPIRPERSVLSDYCIQTTGITPDQVAYGYNFLEACQMLEDLYATRRRAWAAYGIHAQEAIYPECRRRGLRIPFLNKFWNVKYLSAVGLGLTEEPILIDAMQGLGIPRNGNHRRAEEAAPMIAAVFVELMRHLRSGAQGVTAPPLKALEAVA